jgi:hypothetical protein
MSKDRRWLNIASNSNSNSLGKLRTSPPSSPFVDVDQPAVSRNNDAECTSARLWHSLWAFLSASVKRLIEGTGCRRSVHSSTTTKYHVRSVNSTNASDGNGHTRRHPEGDRSTQDYKCGRCRSVSRSCKDVLTRWNSTWRSRKRYGSITIERRISLNGPKNIRCQSASSDVGTATTQRGTSHGACAAYWNAIFVVGFGKQ